MPAPDSYPEALYNIIFTGTCAPGHDPTAMRRGVQALFRLDDTRAQRLFRAAPVAVKQGVDLATARRFEAAFTEVGAVVEIESAEVEETIVATAAPEPAPAPAPVRRSEPVTDSSGGWPAPAPVDAIEQALLDHAARGGDPLEDDWADQSDDRGPTVDPDDLSLAPVGATLVEHDDQAPVPFPDTSHLALVLDPNWSLEDCDTPPPRTRLPPIDHLRLEPIVAPPPRGGTVFD